jgi:hypothetical protein
MVRLVGWVTTLATSIVGAFAPSGRPANQVAWISLYKLGLKISLLRVKARGELILSKGRKRTVRAATRATARPVSMQVVKTKK